MQLFKVSSVSIKSKSEEDTSTSRRDGKKDEPDDCNPAEASLLQKVIRKGLVENKNDVEIQRKNPNSPLYSVKTFEALEL